MEDIPATDQPGHGFGCRSIQRIAQQYGGLCSFTPQRRCFHPTGRPAPGGRGGKVWRRAVRQIKMRCAPPKGELSAKLTEGFRLGQRPSPAAGERKCASAYGRGAEKPTPQSRLRRADSPFRGAVFGFCQAPKKRHPICSRISTVPTTSELQSRIWMVARPKLSLGISRNTFPVAKSRKPQRSSVSQ